MLARLSLLLDGEEIDYRKSSLLQGVLMERIDARYVEFLHQQQMHPYSQFVCKTDKGTVWNIQTLNQEAYEQIIVPIIRGSNLFVLTHSGQNVSLLDKKLETMELSELVKGFYAGDVVRHAKLELLTPTAFKQNGHYVILPDVRLVCQNLMQRFSAISDTIDMIDKETLDQLAVNVFVTKHRIQSKMFPLEGHSLPGFCGNIVLRCNGSETMARYLQMLLAFGEFSGLGIKTAIGMGAIRLRRDMSC